MMDLVALENDPAFVTDALRQGELDYLETVSEAAEALNRAKAQPVRTIPRVGRNDPCPCGSGKKYKRCCGKEARQDWSARAFG